MKHNKIIVHSDLIYTQIICSFIIRIHNNNICFSLQLTTSSPGIYSSKISSYNQRTERRKNKGSENYSQRLNRPQIKRPRSYPKVTARVQMKKKQNEHFSFPWLKDFDLSSILKGDKRRF